MDSSNEKSEIPDIETFFEELAKDYAFQEKMANLYVRMIKVSKWD